MGLLVRAMESSAEFVIEPCSEGIRMTSLARA